MLYRQVQEDTSRRRTLHSSQVPSKHFQTLLERFSIQFDIYPSFTVIEDPRWHYIKEWGELRLPKIPEDPLSLELKYWVINGLAYHAIAPATEYNRTMLRYVIANHFQRLSTNSPAVSWISGIFCTLLSFTKLSRNKRWQFLFKQLLQWKIQDLKEKEKSLIRDLVSAYFTFLLTGEVESEYAKEVEQLYHILRQPTRMERKIRGFIDVIKDILKEEALPTHSFENKVQDFATSLGKPLNHRQPWDKTRSDTDKKNKLSPEDVAKLAQINQRKAERLAKRRDRRESKSQSKKGEKVSSTSVNWLPRYSERQEMLQKLLSQRRFIAAIRRTRLKLLLEKIGKFKGQRNMKVGGSTQWTLEDDPEHLEVELSMENFGYLIPTLTTLKNFWVHGTPGKRKGGARYVELLIDTSKSMQGKPLERAIDVALAITEKAKEREDYLGLTTFSSGAWEGFPPCRSYYGIEEVLLRLMAHGGTNVRHALKRVESHLNSSDWEMTLFLITDTAIWDMKYSTIRTKLRRWADTFPVVLIALGKKIYTAMRTCVQKSNIEMIHLPKLNRPEFEVILTQY